MLKSFSECACFLRKTAASLKQTASAAYRALAVLLEFTAKNISYLDNHGYNLVDILEAESKETKTIFRKHLAESDTFS